jgi:hypothetical protein
MYLDIYTCTCHGIYHDMYLTISYNQQDCVCLVAQYLHGQKTADQFNVNTDMDLSGEAGPSVVCKATAFLQLYCCSSRAAGAKSKHTELSLVFKYI